MCRLRQCRLQGQSDVSESVCGGGPSGQGSYRRKNHYRRNRRHRGEDSIGRMSPRFRRSVCGQGHRLLRAFLQKILISVFQAKSNVPFRLVFVVCAIGCTPGVCTDSVSRRRRPGKSAVRTRCRDVQRRAAGAAPAHGRVDQDMGRHCPCRQYERGVGIDRHVVKRSGRTRCGRSMPVCRVQELRSHVHVQKPMRGACILPLGPTAEWHRIGGRYPYSGK